MNARALLVSVIVVGSSAVARTAWAGVIATDSATDGGLATQAGVFGVAIAVAYYLLRRGDSREKDLHVQAQADLKAMRDEMALMRADYLQTRDKLIAVLAENVDLLHRLNDKP